MTCRADIRGGLSMSPARGPGEAVGADGSRRLTHLAEPTQALRWPAQIRCSADVGSVTFPRREPGRKPRSHPVTEGALASAVGVIE